SRRSPSSSSSPTWIPPRVAAPSARCSARARRAASRSSSSWVASSWCSLRRLRSSRGPTAASRRSTWGSALPCPPRLPRCRRGARRSAAATRSRERPSGGGGADEREQRLAVGLRRVVGLEHRDDAGALGRHAVAGTRALRHPLESAEGSLQQLPQLLLAGQPEGVLEGHRVEGPLGGAVEAEHGSARVVVRLDRHVAHREDVALELATLELEGVAGGGSPHESRVAQRLGQSRRDHRPRRPEAARRAVPRIDPPCLFAGVRGRAQRRSKRSSSMTFTHAATKSCTNLSCASSLAYTSARARSSELEPKTRSFRV